MSYPDHDETEEDNRVTKDDNRVTEDDNRDKELSKSINRSKAKRQFIRRYGKSNSYLIYDFEKCKGNRLKEDVILFVLLNMGVSAHIFRHLFNVGLSRLERISGKKTDTMKSYRTSVAKTSISS